MAEYTQAQKDAMAAYKKPFIDQLNNSDIIQVLGLTKAGRSGYVCPLCGSGSGGNKTGLQVTKDHKRVTCFADPSCPLNGNGHGQDVYGALQAITGKSGNDILRDHFPAYQAREALNALKATSGPAEAREGAQGGNTQGAAERPAEGLTEAIESKPDNTPFYQSCKAHMDEQAAQAYLSLRGIGAETAARYWIGYDQESGAVIVPCSTSFYISRSINQAAGMRYKNPAGVSIELFNKKALYNEAGRPVFVTEGAFDALSVIEAGGEAVGLNGTPNVHKLLDQLKRQRTGNTLILCLDADSAGEKAAAELEKGLHELNISCVRADICGDHKDPNEALTADRAAFVDAVEAAESKTSKPDNTADYIKRSMAADIEALRAQSDRKTGFPNLDREAHSIYAGLYVIGGISSVGKTTFISQIADQMAAQGHHVLFFSMEQSRLEMVSKSLSRLTARANHDNAVSSLLIRTGTQGENVHKAIEEYTATVGDRVSIIEGNFNCTAGYIKGYTRQYIARNGGTRPVVIVDYLQVLQADVDESTGRKPTDAKQIVDYSITQLKRMSRELEIPVFVVSSLNRGNYLAPIDFEAFKESGGIEYTADVVWGLQLAVMNDELFDKDKNVKAKREKVAEAKAAIPRNIELVCLKNRYGKSRYTARFSYYPQYDYFEPEDVSGMTIVHGPTPW